VGRGATTNNHERLQPIQASSLSHLSLGRPSDFDVGDDAILNGNQLGLASTRLAAVGFETGHAARVIVNVTVDAALDGGQLVVAGHQTGNAQLGVNSATKAVFDVE